MVKLDSGGSRPERSRSPPERSRSPPEKEAAKKDQAKAPWDTPEEWAWHDAHAEGWAAAADEEKQNAAERSGSAAEGLDSSESETLQMDQHPSTPQASTAVAANDEASNTNQALRIASPRFDAIAHGFIDHWRVHKDEVAHLAHLFQVESFDERDHRRADSDFDDAH